jgi:uncharacterized protein
VAEVARRLKFSAPLLFLAALPALAVDWKTLKPEGYVSDFARVIDPQSRAELESYGTRVEQASGVQMAFVTIRSLQGEPIEDVTNDIFHNWGVGQKGKDNGLMVLLAVGDRRSRLEVGGGLGESIPDSMAGMILDDMRPALRAGQYGTAVLLAATRLGSSIAQAKGLQISAPGIPWVVPRSTRDRIPWPLIIVAILIFLTVARRFGRAYYSYSGGGIGFWQGMWLGEMLSSGNRRDFGGRDGGGFGGFDSGSSGGGFDGFGGGDSGGGGASSDW